MRKKENPTDRTTRRGFSTASEKLCLFLRREKNSPNSSTRKKGESSFERLREEKVTGSLPTIREKKKTGGALALLGNKSKEGRGKTSSFFKKSVLPLSCPTRSVKENFLIQIRRERSGEGLLWNTLLRGGRKFLASLLHPCIAIRSRLKTEKGTETPLLPLRQSSFEREEMSITVPARLYNTAF